LIPFCLRGIGPPLRPAAGRVLSPPLGQTLLPTRVTYSPLSSPCFFFFLYNMDSSKLCIGLPRVWCFWLLPLPQIRGAACFVAWHLRPLGSPSRPLLHSRVSNRLSEVSIPTSARPSPPHFFFSWPSTPSPADHFFFGFQFPVKRIPFPQDPQKSLGDAFYSE